MSTPSLLVATGLHKSYPAVKVLKGVDLRLAPSETLAVIGPNGAGKTTLFKVLTGEVRADEGAIQFDSRDVTHLPGHERVRMGIGRTFQSARVFHDVSVLDNVIVALESSAPALRRGISRLAWWPEPQIVGTAREILADLGLDAKRNELPRNLSHGDKKRLELGCCLALRPRVLMLDEPTAGMSPQDRASAVELIMRLRDREKFAIMLTEHDMGVVFGLADRIIVLNYGELIAEGTGEEVRANPQVRDIYLGTGGGHA